MPIYLDNAASSCPKPATVVEAVDRCLREHCANPGRGAHKTAVAAARIIYQTRQKAAQLLGVGDSADVMFTMNATDSLNLAMYGLLRPGDHVVTSIVEHNAVLRPLKVLAETGVDVSIVGADSAGRVDPGDIMDALRPQTKLVALGHASNVTGAIQPVEDIAAALKERGVTLLVDAAQSAGTLPLDMGAAPVGLLACTGHKSLMGPQGVGLLYISPDIELRSVRQGGTGTRSEAAQDELSRPDRYEAGTLNTPGIAGLGAGIDYVQEEGLERLRAHKQELTSGLVQGLMDIESVDVYGPALGEERGPLVCFNVAELPPSEVAAALDKEFDVASRAGLHCAPGAHQVMGTGGRGAVRLSVGPFNIEDEITQAVAAVSEIAGRAARAGDKD